VITEHRTKGKISDPETRAYVRKQAEKRKREEENQHKKEAKENKSFDPYDARNQ
jgi:hypothetical protein